MLTTEVARRLEQKLGLGEFPLVRRRLYARVQRLCEMKGDEVLQIVANVVEEAHGPKVRDKGQYFCWVIKRRLEEAGWWTPADPGPNQTREQARQLGTTVAKIGAPATSPAADQAAAEIERLRLSNELLKRQVAQARRDREGGAW